MTTRKRNDNHSTEFGLWLREQCEIDSNLGYIATNIDYMWKNYKTGEWMLIEEKRYNREPTWPQRGMFKTIHRAIDDDKYKGCHLLQFENTDPDDGEIRLDEILIDGETLMRFLKFEAEEEEYDRFIL